ncbi:MAG TPA: phosphate ABC transporter ATP-binding protein [Burkholderiales bacterium]|jgi:tungstate transport system ATP-binding protein|nr:phosphate ABC transporter ATP-binding protein [Burkholderiales bacterium]
MLPLVLQNVSFAADGKVILDSISGEFGAGPRTVILGPNGAGKSILMRICHGLLQPTSGSVTWKGPVNGRRGQAMVFQRPVMLRRSAFANVIYGLKLAGITAHLREQRACDVLEAVGLTSVSSRPARVLSGGEQQRLALARAWSLNPEILFLDEPTANLDPGATRDVENIINQIHACGTKIVMTTHNLGQAKRLGDEILFLNHGRLVERSPGERFFQQPATAEAAAFIRGELPWN